jgi:hypothetical protein
LVLVACEATKFYFFGFGEAIVKYNIKSTEEEGQ